MRTRLTVESLKADGLIPQEPRYTNESHDTYFPVHVSGNGHKVHRSSVTVWHESGNVNVDSPWCGSERWGTYRNPVITKADITCGKCLKRAR